MEEDDVSAILQRVEKATEIFTRHVATSAESSHSGTPHARESPLISDDISALKRIMEELQRFVASFGSQRVLTLSGSQLMEAGVNLYNAPRPAFKILEEVEKLKQQAAELPRSFPRYLLAATRFTAAKIMGLALIFSKESGRQEGDVKRGSHYMDECVNVLRSFGRVGMLMLESASVDCDNCQEYLAFAKESFSCSLQLWARIGLSHLTKFKQDLELEEIVDDLWDFCMDHVRVLQLLTEDSNDSVDETQEIVTSLHELKMLVPYKSSYAADLLDLMRGVSEGYDHMGHHEKQIAFVEEAMRVCDSLESNGEEEFAECVTSFRQNTLVNFLRSLCATGDVDRAETCCHLIPDNRDPKVLLLMVKLYVENKLFDKAHHLLRLLFQQDSLDKSIVGARIYAQGLSFSEEGMDVYGELLRNYGDSMFEISVELACVLACVESKRHRAMIELKRLGSDIHEMEREGQSVDCRHIERIRQTVFDAAQDARNSNQHEDCLKWADVGLVVSSTTEEAAVYMRIMSHSNLKLGRGADASIWAEKAFASEASKNSLFTLFQVALESKEGEQSAARILDRLKARDDFGIQDLLAFGKLASNAGPEKQDVVLHILDELCDMLIRGEECPASLPKGIVLQNAAQLAFAKFTRRSFGPKEQPESSYGEKFLTYARALMQLSKLDTAYGSDTFAPPSVFEWFYGMCFNIAKSTDDLSYFVMAADIADRSDEVFKDASPLKQRSPQCLLAAISSDVKNFETLDKNKLRQLLQVILRYESTVGVEEGHNADVSQYLAKSLIATKLRLFNANTDEMFELCKAKLGQNVDEFIEIGELVLYATKFDEATEVRGKYRSLARSLFKYGIQLLVQSDIIDPSKLSYLLRRLINLAESKSAAYEWLEQLVQIFDSFDMSFSEVDIEWFAGKSWNIGISYQRNEDMQEARKFMKMSLAILAKGELSMGKMGQDLHAQYQSLLTMDTARPIRPAIPQNSWC